MPLHVCHDVAVSTTTQIPKTLTKHEVIALLGKSKRTIDTYMKDGRLPYHYVHGPNGKQAEFHAADVERLKRDLDTPIERGVVERAPNGLALVPDTVAALTPLVDEIASAIRCIDLTPQASAPRAVYVSLKDACAITGLSAATIRALAEGVEIKTRPYGGGVRYRRADLEAL
jgi:hypothetical protein